MAALAPSAQRAALNEALDVPGACVSTADRRKLGISDGAVYAHMATGASYFAGSLVCRAGPPTQIACSCDL